MDERPSLWLHLTWLSLLAGLVAVVMGACLLHIDKVVRCVGEVRSPDRSSQIFAPVAGRLLDVHVDEGTRVAKGDRLVTIEPDVNGLGIAPARLKLVRAAAAYAAWSDSLPSVVPSSDEERQTQLTIRQSVLAELAGSRAALRSQAIELEEAQAALQVEEANQRRLAALQPLVQEKLFQQKELVRSGYQAPVALIAPRQEAIDLSEQIAVAEARIAQARRTLDRRRTALEATRAEIERRRAEHLAQTYEAMVQAGHDVRRLTELAQKTVIESPADGYVEQLSARLSSNVVGGGERLLTVAPASSRYEVHLQIRNEDYPWLRVGQEVDVKFDAFPYTVFGSQKARLIRLSRDPLTGNNEAVYGVVALLDPGSFNGDGEAFELREGMKVAADIGVGLQRPIDIWLAPFIRFGREAFRDRS